MLQGYITKALTNLNGMFKTMSMDKRLELSRANISPESADLRDERTVLLPLELVQLSLIILSGKPFGAAVRCQACRMHVVENALLRIGDWTHISHEEIGQWAGLWCIEIRDDHWPTRLWIVDPMSSVVGRIGGFRSGCAIATCTKWDYGGSRGF